MTARSLHPLAKDYLGRLQRLEALEALERLGSPGELVLLWSSPLWTTRDKLIGTLIVPGGIATTLVVVVLTGTTRRCREFARRARQARLDRRLKALTALLHPRPGPVGTPWAGGLVSVGGLRAGASARASCG